MSSPRPALVFDFGNVLAFFDFTRACDAYGRMVGLSGTEFLGRLRANGLTPLLESYERGGMSSADFTRSVCHLAGLEIGHEAFAAAWGDIFTLNEPVARLARSLSLRGYTLVVGSNTNEMHAARFRRQFREELSYFDRLVLSYEVGHAKPSPEFYHACAAAAGRDPGACVFIDDVAENVEGARSAGLLGVLYRDPPTLVDDLRGLGVEVGAVQI